MWKPSARRAAMWASSVARRAAFSRASARRAAVSCGAAIRREASMFGLQSWAGTQCQFAARALRHKETTARDGARITKNTYPSSESIRGTSSKNLFPGLSDWNSFSIAPCLTELGNIAPGQRRQQPADDPSADHASLRGRSLSASGSSQPRKWVSIQFDCRDFGARIFQ